MNTLTNLTDTIKDTIDTLIDEATEKFNLTMAQGKRVFERVLFYIDNPKVKFAPDNFGKAVHYVIDNLDNKKLLKSLHSTNATVKLTKAEYKKVLAVLSENKKFEVKNWIANGIKEFARRTSNIQVIDGEIVVKNDCILEYADLFAKLFFDNDEDKELAKAEIEITDRYFWKSIVLSISGVRIYPDYDEVHFKKDNIEIKGWMDVNADKTIKVTKSK